MMKCDWIALAILVLSLATLVFGVPATLCYCDYVQAEAAVEQLALDAMDVEPHYAEDVVGQITAFNQRIRGMQALNRTPVLCLYIPNGWDDMVVIEMAAK